MAQALTYRQAEYGYYYEEHEDYYEDECEYDDEQCAYYYQDYTKERSRDIRKQLVRRNQSPSQDTTAQQTGEGNAATKEATRRASDGDSDHRSPPSRRNNSKSKRTRTTRRGRRSRGLITLLNGFENG
jgi:hypothetical protein